MKLQTKIMLSVSMMIIILVFSFGAISFYSISYNIETQMANSAMDYARTIAAMDVIGQGLAEKVPFKSIATYIESLRVQTRYQYIIVMDMDGIQYSYPYKSGIGEKYKNGGESNVLENGVAEKSADRNTLISAIRAFVPIYYEEEQVGAVLVGLLTDEVYQELKISQRNIRIALTICLIFGFIITYLLSKNIKKSTFGLEPKDIGLLVSEKELIFNSIDQGMIAIDVNGIILSINQAAMDILEITEGNIGEKLNAFSSVFSNYMTDIIDSAENTLEEEVRLNSQTKLIVGTSLMKDPDNKIVGAVANIVLFNHARELAEKLTDYEGLIDSLRAQSHEFRNKLHTVSGLIQLMAYEEAIEYIDEITFKGNFIHSFIVNNIKNKKVSGLLLAKYNRLVELKISLEFSDDSYIYGFPQKMDSVMFCSFLGNLLDNSKDAVIDHKNPKIQVKIQSDLDHCYIEVTNNGPSIKEEDKNKIFEKYYTSKENGNGVGLYLLKTEIEALNGRLEFVNDKGVTWYVRIPE